MQRKGAGLEHAKVSMSDTIVGPGERTSGPSCPICYRPVERLPQPCARCGSVYHAECWPAPGGCVVPGCRKPRQIAGPPPPSRELRLWLRWSLVATVMLGIALL